MTGRNLKVLFVSAEVAPFSSVGGLSQVSYFLPRVLLKMGVDVRIFTPKYGTIDEKKFPLKMAVEELRVPTGEEAEAAGPQELICNVKIFGEQKKTEPTVYFLENAEYYEKRANVYGYSDDHIRFGLLSRGALEFIKTERFVPDLIHANDWHVAYLINFLRDNYKNDPVLRKIATLLSVHNLHQGSFDFGHATDMDFDDGKAPLASFFSERFYKQNALKRGIMNADIVNTVSETYSREIMREEYGWGLDKLFKELRGKLFGVLNGLDYQDFNPATDKLIKKNYGTGSTDARRENKIDLQKEFHLEVAPDKPILAMAGRLDGQKGLDLVLETLEFILTEFPEVQFIAMGGGDLNYRDRLEDFEKRFPQRVGTHLMPNWSLPRKIFAGADVLLLPSKYEPGGITALEAMRYGCVPLVRATGGLNDSVTDYDSVRNVGTGFKFINYAKESFLVTVVRVLEAYRHKDAWKKLVKRCMEQDFSWPKVAEKYLDLYSRAMKFRHEALLPNPPTVFRQMM